MLTPRCNVFTELGLPARETKQATHFVRAAKTRRGTTCNCDYGTGPGPLAPIPGCVAQAS